MSGVVNEGGLIGDVDRDRILEVDRPLALAIHRLNAVSGVALLGLRNAQQHFGILVRVLHPHAAMAVGAHGVVEQFLVRRVVLIDQEAIREVEADAAERVSLAGRLEDADRTVGIVADFQPTRASALGPVPAPADIRC